MRAIRFLGQAPPAELIGKRCRFILEVGNGKLEAGDDSSKNDAENLLQGSNSVKMRAHSKHSCYAAALITIQVRMRVSKLIAY